MGGSIKRLHHTFANTFATNGKVFQTTDNSAGFDAPQQIYRCYSFYTNWANARPEWPATVWYTSNYQNESESYIIALKLFYRFLGGKNAANDATTDAPPY